MSVIAADVDVGFDSCIALLVAPLKIFVVDTLPAPIPHLTAFIISILISIVPCVCYILFDVPQPQAACVIIAV